jgi:hypothetical protein
MKKATYVRVHLGDGLGVNELALVGKLRKDLDDLYKNEEMRAC